MATDFYELLNAIRLRPAMYISSASITALYNFLAGYYMSADFSKIANETKPPFRDFNNWVQLRLGCYGSGWRSMLLEAENGDEEKAFERFFVFLDEFRQRQTRVILWADLPPSQEQRKTKLVQIIKYTDDEGVFMQYVDADGKVLDEYYWRTLDDAFFIAESQIGKLEWKSPET